MDFTDDMISEAVKRPIDYARGYFEKRCTSIRKLGTLL